MKCECGYIFKSSPEIKEHLQCPKCKKSMCDFTSQTNGKKLFGRLRDEFIDFRENERD